MPKISIIIPVYNAQQSLQNCLDSICNQTLKDIEIICVNDCSKDNSLLILQEYAKNDERIKLINFAENQGAAVARNIGIENASSQYLGFVDSDDFIDKDFYEKLYHKAILANADAVKGNLMLYYPKTKLARKEAWIDLNEKVKKHHANFYYSFTSAIYNTVFIKEKSIKFLEGLIHFEDPYFTIKAALFYEKLEVVDDVFYYYVHNPNSTSRQKITINHIESQIAGTVAVLDMLDEYCLDKTHYIIIFNFLLEQILCWCNRNDVKDEINVKAVSGLFLLYSRCKYQAECTEFHFLQKKKNHKEEIIRNLRNKVKDELKNA